MKQVAWRTFDGEGGYDYRSYDENENYAVEWAKRNPKHANWVEPLYLAQQAEPVADADAWLRQRYGGYKAHPEWRALAEAFNAGMSCKQKQAEPVRAYYTIDELNKKYGDETGNPSY